MIEVALDHLHARSLDPDAAARFYVDHFGAQILERTESAESLRVVVRIAAIRLFIERAPEGTAAGAKPPHRGWEHIGFTVADLDAAAAALREQGVVFTVEPKIQRPGLRIAFIRGPDDVSIELLERRDG